MKQLLVFTVFSASCLFWAVSSTSICFAYNGGFFYTTNVTAQTCNQICEPYGGFDAIASRHTGNAVGVHFHPEKANPGDWETIECSSTDNFSNWGANGADPDPTFSHNACLLNCACNFGTDDCEGSICANLNAGDRCNYRYLENGTAMYVNGTCGDDGTCFAPGFQCGIAPCFGVFNETGSCIYNDSMACSTESIDVGCGMCMSGSCIVQTNATCDDGNANNCDDMCSSAGTCSGTTCPVPIAAPVSVPVAAPVSTPIAKKASSGAMIIPATIMTVISSLLL